MEYLLPLIPALAWGSIGIISAKMGGTTEQKTIGSMTGFMIFALLIFFLARPSLDLGLILTGLASGGLLSLSNFGQFDGMTQLGVSRAVPLVASGQLILNTLIGALVFKEWTQAYQWILGLLALGLIILGARETSFSQDKSHGAMNRQGLVGVILAIFAGAFYAIVPKGYQYFSHLAGGDSYTYGLMLPQAMGGLGGSFLIYLVRNHENPLREYKTVYPWRNTLSGLAWALGNLFMLRASTGSIGLATAFTLSQLNLVVGGIGGIVILKERKTRLEMKHFLLGLALVIGGAVITSRL